MAESWKIAVDAELGRLRAQESALKQANGSSAELKEIAKRKGQLKMMKKKGINPVISAPSVVLPKGGSSGPSLPSFSLPPYPTFTPPLSQDEAAEFAGTLTFGSLSGFCSGYALKKIGRAGATTAGVLFMALTAAQKSGYIDVNWGRIETDLMGNFDLNNDGKVDWNDMTQARQHFVRYMTENNSAVTASTFSAGLLFGLRQG